MRFASRVLGLALLVALATPAPAQDKKDDPKKDDKEAAAKAAEQKKLQGTWKIVSAEAVGKPLQPKDVGIDTIVVVESKMTLKNGDKEVASYPFELYPDNKPKGLLWKNEKQKGLHPVVYEIDGDKLKLCFPLLSTEPPKEAPKPPENFDTKDKPVMLLVAEREKKP